MTWTKVTDKLPEELIHVLVISEEDAEHMIHPEQSVQIAYIFKGKWLLVYPYQITNGEQEIEVDEVCCWAEIPKFHGK